MTHSARAPACLEIGHRHARGHRDPLRERVQWRLGSANAECVAGFRVGGGQQPCDELAATQDACICCGRRPGLPQGAESGPSAHAPAEPTFLELGAAALGHPFRHKDTVYGSRARYRRPELAEDRPHGLPRAADGPHEGTMPGPRIPVQGTETWNDAGADRVEVTVPQRTVRSIPRTMMWWRVFDASRRGWRDMATERVAVVVIECNIYSSRYEPTGPFSKHLKMSQAVAVGIVRVVGRQRAVRGDFGDATSLILKAVPEGRSTRL